MSFVKHYKIKMKSISPIHIGTGDSYEPTNYVMDEDENDINGKKISTKFLFSFDEVKFYSDLSHVDKQEFTRLVAQTDTKGILNLQNLIVKNKKIARSISTRIVKVSDEVFDEYTEKIARVVQKEGGGNKKQKEILNQLLIQKCYTAPSGNRQGVIPGSSLKGAISTAYQEMLSENANYERMVKPKLMSASSDNPFRLLLLSDSSEAQTWICKTTNIKRRLRKQEMDMKSTLSTKLEAIVANQEIEANLSIKQDKNGNFLDIMDIVMACNKHYLPIFRSVFDDENGETCKVLSEKFYEDYRKFGTSSLKKNEFLLRVGKHSGARSVTIDGLRSIRIKCGGKDSGKLQQEETTIWLAEAGEKDSMKRYLPFGWLLCRIEEVSS